MVCHFAPLFRAILKYYCRILLSTNRTNVYDKREANKYFLFGKIVLILKLKILFFFNRV